MGSISDRFKRHAEFSRDLDRQISRLEELEAAQGSTGAAGFGNVGRAAGSHSDRTGRLAAACLDLRERIREMTAEELAERRELEKILSVTSGGRYLLKVNEKAAVRCRYFDRLSIDDAAEVLGISVSCCKYSVKDALRKLDEKFDEQEK